MERYLKLAFAGFLLLVLLGLMSVAAASNTVPTSNAALKTMPVTANDLKPSACSALNLTHVVNLTGSSANSLVLGTVLSDTLQGQGGDDCLVGGDGDDALFGGDGSNDICIGGDGTDTCDDSCEVKLGCE